MRFSWRSSAGIAAFWAGASWVIGCSVAPMSHQSNSNPAPTPTPTPSTAAFSGVIHGGQNPVGGGNVYLLEASRASDYGQLSTSLINNTSSGGINGGWHYVTTAANGTFTIPGSDYHCDQGYQVYLYAVGGDAGFGTNSAIGLMASLGPCGAGNSFSNLPSVIQLNEVTTVVAAYSLAGFASDATHISSPNTSLALTGIANASLNARSLVDLGTGLAPATTANGGVVPQEMIDTLANILAACINSSTPNSGGCDTLLHTATSDGTGTGNQPGDTATAAIDIAHHPGANVTTLFGTITTTPPFLFSPQYTSAPSDFAVGVGYSSGGLTAPTAIAIDAGGNAWITDTPALSAGAVIELGPQGSVASGSPFDCGATLTAPTSIALGPSFSSPQTAWVASANGGTVTGVPSTGGCTSLSPPTPCGANPWCAPVGLAVNSNRLYVVDKGLATLESFDFSGNHIEEWPNGNSTTGNIFLRPSSLAIDGAGLIWVTDQGDFSHNATFDFISGDDIDIADASAPFGLGSNAVAIGSGANQWITDSGADSVFLFTTGGTFVNSTFTSPTGGVSTPVAVAVDGAGNSWIANAGGSGGGASDVAAMAADGTQALSPDSGFTGGGLITNDSSPTGIAVDPSGNVWVAVQNGASPVMEFIGLGTPTVTPLADAAANNTIATKP